MLPECFYMQLMMRQLILSVMLSPLSSSLSFLPSDIFLQDHMTARQNAPQCSFSSQKEAAVRMLFPRPLQQVLEEEGEAEISKSVSVTV